MAEMEISRAHIDVTKGRGGLERSDGEDDEFMICRNTREMHMLEEGKEALSRTN